MKINYNKFTEQELRVILNAARTINYGFGLQFTSHKEQLALLLEDEQSRTRRRHLPQSSDQFVKSLPRKTGVRLVPSIFLDCWKCWDA